LTNQGKYAIIGYNLRKGGGTMKWYAFYKGEMPVLTGLLDDWNVARFLEMGWTVTECEKPE